MRLISVALGTPYLKQTDKIYFTEQIWHTWLTHKFCNNSNSFLLIVKIVPCLIPFGKEIFSEISVESALRSFETLKRGGCKRHLRILYLYKIYLTVYSPKNRFYEKGSFVSFAHNNFRNFM